MAWEKRPLLTVDAAEQRLYDGQRHSTIGLQGLRLERGVSYALCGPSGIGKTTALEMLALARRPTVIEGMRLSIGDRDIDIDALWEQGAANALTALRGRHFGYILQTSRLLPFLSVHDNVVLSQTIAGIDDPDFAAGLMEHLGLAVLASARPSDLSGGQRQRVCVARALAHKPSIILADEPTSSVDAELGRTILRLLTSYAADSGACLVVITHDGDLVDRYGLLPLRVESAVAGQRLSTVFSMPFQDARGGGNLARSTRDRASGLEVSS